MGDAGTLSVAAQDALTGAGVQSVTGAKTFSDQKLLLRNPANTFTGTLINPVLTSAQNLELTGPYSHLAYLAGSTLKIKDMNTTGIVASGTAHDTVIQSVIDGFGNNSGKHIHFLPGTYTITTPINSNAVNGVWTVSGDNALGAATFQPAGDNAIFDISGVKGRINLEKLYFKHANASYTKGMITLRDGPQSCSIKDCYFSETGGYKGYAIKLENTGSVGSVFKNMIWGCESQGFDAFLYANVTQASSSTNYINANQVIGCNIWNAHWACKVDNVASGAFDDNHWSHCEIQCDANSLGGFNYDNAGHSWYTMHNDIMIQDIPSGKKYADVGSNTQLSLVNCYPATLKGSGTTNGFSANVMIRNQYLNLVPNTQMTANTQDELVLYRPAIGTGATFRNALRFDTNNNASTQYTMGYVIFEPTTTGGGVESTKCEIWVRKAGVATQAFTVDFSGAVDQKITTIPADPASGFVRYYPKTIDANNDGFFAKEKVNGAVVEVQL